MNKALFNLKPKDRRHLQSLTKTGRRNSREFEHAYILLALDKGRKSKEIIEFYNVSRVTIWRVKNKYLEQGINAALKDEYRSGQPAKYREKEVAEIITLACSQAPEGRVRWTLRLLESRLKQKEGMETINRETIRLVLKKTNVSLG